jgi:large subunit ribosomal protein L10
MNARVFMLYSCSGETGGTSSHNDGEDQMNRTEKAELIETLNSAFGVATSVVVTHQTGMTVAESGELRQKMREVGATYKVTKNRVTKLALQGTPFEDLAEFFTGPTAVSTSSDAIAAARTIFEFTKTNDKVSIVGGGLDGKILSKEEVVALAKLPSLDELRGKIVGLLQAPAGKVAGVIGAPAGGLARVIKARAKQLG